MCVNGPSFVQIWSIHQILQGFAFILYRQSQEIAQTCVPATILLQIGNVPQCKRCPARRYLLGVNDTPGGHLDDRLAHSTLPAGYSGQYRHDPAHRSWQHFLTWVEEQDRRLILATTKAQRSYREFEFRPNDILLFGRESAGVPDDVHAAADHCLLIPMAEGTRSLNLAISTALIAVEAIRHSEMPAPAQ